MTRARE